MPVLMRSFSRSFRHRFIDAFSLSLVLMYSFCHVFLIIGGFGNIAQLAYLSLNTMKNMGLSSSAISQ